MSKSNEKSDFTAEDSPHFTLDSAGDEKPPAWEEVDVGRYMPRRVRGSCQGRALG